MNTENEGQVEIPDHIKAIIQSENPTMLLKLCLALSRVLFLFENKTKVDNAAIQKQLEVFNSSENVKIILEWIGIEVNENETLMIDKKSNVSDKITSFACEAAVTTGGLIEDTFEDAVQLDEHTVYYPEAMHQLLAPADQESFFCIKTIIDSIPLEERGEFRAALEGIIRAIVNSTSDKITIEDIAPEVDFIHHYLGDDFDNFLLWLGIKVNGDTLSTIIDFPIIIQRKTMFCTSMTFDTLDKQEPKFEWSFRGQPHLPKADLSLKPSIIEFPEPKKLCQNLFPDSKEGDVVAKGTVCYMYGISYLRNAEPGEPDILLDPQFLDKYHQAFVKIVRTVDGFAIEKVGN